MVEPGFQPRQSFPRAGVIDTKLLMREAYGIKGRSPLLPPCTPITLYLPISLPFKGLSGRVFINISYKNIYKWIFPMNVIILLYCSVVCFSFFSFDLGICRSISFFYLLPNIPRNGFTIILPLTDRWAVSKFLILNAMSNASLNILIQAFCAHVLIP